MPNDHHAELSELQKEWRREVADTLKELRATSAALNSQLAEMREQFARERDLELIEKRVYSLESDRAKFLGGVFIIQAIGATIIWLIVKLWK